MNRKIEFTMPQPAMAEAVLIKHLMPPGAPATRKVPGLLPGSGERTLRSQRMSLLRPALAEAMAQTRRELGCRTFAERRERRMEEFGRALTQGRVIAALLSLCH